MGVICHSVWVSVWWSDCISRVNADGEPEPPTSTNKFSRETVATRGVTGEMMEKVCEENWALWTYIIESWEDKREEEWRGLTRKVWEAWFFFISCLQNTTEPKMDWRRRYMCAAVRRTYLLPWCQGETSPISVFLINDVNLFPISRFHTVYWKLAIQMSRTCWSSAFLQAQSTRKNYWSSVLMPLWSWELSTLYQAPCFHSLYN